VIRLVLRSQFERDGFDVVPASSVREARRRLTGGEIDLAIVDVRLPDGDGFELARDIKDRQPAIPVIVMSSQGVDEGQDRARESGAYAYVSKPFRYDRLLDLLAEAFR